MSKSEILEELPRLGLADRREIWRRLCELEEQDLLRGAEPTAAEKALLDEEVERFRSDPESGASWEAVQARLREHREM